MTHIFLIVLLVITALVGLLTLGLVLKPRPFRSHPAPMHPGKPRPFQRGLPEPVEKHFLETLGPEPPEISTAVVWGRGRMNMRGVWMPVRFKAWYRGGEAFTRRFEVTFFQRPVMRGRDSFIHGVGTVEVGERVESDDETSRSQLLELWAGMLWMPTIFVHDPRVEWQPVDEHTARLVVPSRGASCSLMAHFDVFTGRLVDLTARRPATEAEKSDPQLPAEEEPWRVDLLAWKRLNGLEIPCKVDIAWGESGSPWVHWNVDGIVYNVNVSDQLGD